MCDNISWYSRMKVALFERQDADLEHISAFWNDVRAENWRDVVMAVIAQHDCNYGADKITAKTAECRIPVANDKFSKVLSEVEEFCKLRGTDVIAYNISGAHLDVMISPYKRAADVATHLEIINKQRGTDFLLEPRMDPWATGVGGSDIAISPAGVSNFEIKQATAEYIIEYMAQVVGGEWRGGRANIHGFFEFMNKRLLYISLGRERVIADAIINNIMENEESFKEDEPANYLRRVERYLQNPDSMIVSPAEYRWAMKQLLSAKCHFDGKELYIKVKLTGVPEEIDIVPYDLGQNTDRVKVRLGIDDEEEYVNVDALRDILLQIREVIMKTG